jgi:tetratricopeptide (TPR) repeat protein
MGLLDGYKKKKFLNNGAKLLNQEKYEDSLECFDKALKLDPNYADAWYNKGFTLFNTGNYQDANECFDKFLEIDPEMFHTYSVILLKTTGLFILKEYQKQLELSNMLIGSSKNSLEKLFALNIKANALLKLEQYDESESIIDNILIEDPESESALANKANILLEHENYKEAIDYYENSLEVYDKKFSEHNSNIIQNNVLLPEKISDNILSEIWVNKGKAHQKLQETSKALECFNKALRLDKDKDSQKIIEDLILNT